MNLTNKFVVFVCVAALAVLYPVCAAAAPKLINSNYGIATQGRVEEFYDGFSYKSDNLRSEMIKTGWREKSLNIWDSNTFAETANCSVSFIDDGNGGDALQIMRSICLPHANTPEFSFDSGSLKCSMRIKIIQDNMVDEESLSYLFAVGASCDGKFLYVKNGKFVLHTDVLHSEKKYKNNEWYTIEWTLSKATDKNTIFDCIIFDENGNEFLSLNKQYNSAKGQIYFGEGLSSEENSCFAIDDVRIISQGKEIVYNPSNGKYVWSTQPVLNLTFDTEIIGNIRLKDAVGREIVSAVEGMDSNKISIIPLEPLKYGENYSIDFTEVTSRYFEALDIASPQSVYFQVMDYNIGEFSVGIPIFYNDSMTVPVQFKNTYVNELSAIVFAALYDEKSIVWVGNCDIENQPIGEIDCIFNDVPTNSSQLKLRIFVWDNMQSIIPLYVEKETVSQ